MLYEKNTGLFLLNFFKCQTSNKSIIQTVCFPSFKVLADFLKRIGNVNVNGKIHDLYFELNKWSFESEFIFSNTHFYRLYTACLHFIHF